MMSGGKETGEDGVIETERGRKKILMKGRWVQ